MNLIKGFMLVIAVFFSTAVLSKPLVVKCDLKFENSPRSKVLKFRVGGEKRAFKHVKIGNSSITVKGNLESTKYDSIITLIFEVRNKTYAEKVSTIGGVKRGLRRVSYGSLGDIIIPDFMGGPSLIASCNI